MCQHGDGTEYMCFDSDGFNDLKDTLNYLRDDHSLRNIYGFNFILFNRMNGLLWSYYYYYSYVGKGKKDKSEEFANCTSSRKNSSCQTYDISPNELSPYLRKLLWDN